MVDQYTDRARKVMGLAREEAHRFNHDHVGTEHLLLGLAGEGSGVAAQVLKNLGVDCKKIRREVQRLSTRGMGQVTTGQLPFTPRAKKALDMSLEEASKLGHTHIGTEHLLLGLLRVDDGVAFKVFRTLKVNVQDVREEVLKVLRSVPPDPGLAPTAETLAAGAAQPAVERILQQLDPKSVLAAAVQEAQRHGRQQAEPEYVLLALLLDADVANLLKQAGIDAATLRAAIEKILQGRPPRGGPPAAP